MTELSGSSAAAKNSPQLGTGFFLEGGSEKFKKATVAAVVPALRERVDDEAWESIGKRRHRRRARERERTPRAEDCPGAGGGGGCAASRKLDVSVAVLHLFPRE